MKALVDTNVLARSGNVSDRAQPKILSSLEQLFRQGVNPCLCGQNVVELWAVATRPINANGQGKTPHTVRRELDALLLGFEMIPDPPELLSVWLDLCTQFEVRGRQVFDARLVALMKAAGISKFVTLNPADFRRYPGIELVVPVAAV